MTDLLTLSAPIQSTALLRLVKKRSEAFMAQQSQHQSRLKVSRRKIPASIPYALFEHVLLTYQLQGRQKLLEPFRDEFDKLDTNHVGILSRVRIWLGSIGVLS